MVGEMTILFGVADVPSESNLVTLDELIPGLQSSPIGEGELLHCSVHLYTPKRPSV